MKTIAHLNHIRKTYGTGEAVLSVLNDFSMEIAEGDFVAIQGRSGSGKTTLLNIIGLLDSDFSGDYELFSYRENGMVVPRNLGDSALSLLRNEMIGFVFQHFNLLEHMTCFENVCLEFRDGKIINATANHTERVNEIFDTDEGARYVGEFALGVNPKITKAMKDILFDEKICGSIHFTPGGCYEDADNGNNSAVHWDLVLIQTPEYGGGEIWFDDVLIRKDGRFVLPELECLNPENLC